MKLSSNGSAVSLVLDVPTRWNSTYDMIQRAIDSSSAINKYIQNDEKLRLCRILDFEWDRMKQLITILKPLKDATLYLSGSKYITISSALPTYFGLIKVISY